MMKRLPSRAFLLASLKLWTRRLNYRRGRVKHWRHRHKPALVAKWQGLERHAEYWVSRRRRELAAGSRKGSFGIDWAWGHPDIPALKAAKVEFACRYLSHDASKNLTFAQAKALGKAGIDCVVVWETAANRALAGRTAGASDAQAALTQAMGCGMPAGCPIYFAVDFDETQEQAKAVAEYFRGVHSVLDFAGPAGMPHPVPVGVYGGYWSVRRLFNAGLVRYGWQTYAWSGGQWERRAQLRQYSNGHTVAGVSCDFNRAAANDFGQWRA
jgi:hypothetical protein